MPFVNDGEFFDVDIPFGGVSVFVGERVEGVLVGIGTLLPFDFLSLVVVGDLPLFDLGFESFDFLDDGFCLVNL